MKKTPLEDFANVRKGGIIAIGIEPGDALIDVKLDFSGTRPGGAHHPRGHEHPLLRRGRAPHGPPGRPECAASSLDQGDAVVALAVVVRRRHPAGRGREWHRQAHALRYGLEDGTIEPVYRLQSRGGKGIITMKANEKTGAVVGALTVATPTKSC